MKDSDITGTPITGVHYKDRAYTFYPYAGRMVSPKGGKLGYIKTAQGKLHGRFYTQGQFFLFEPAPLNPHEPILAGWGENAEAVVNKLLESEYPTEAIEALARRWFQKNARNLYDAHYEVGFEIYLDPQGKLLATPLVQGDEAEVDWGNAPAGSDPVGSLHTHVGCEGELSDWDREQGQKEADRLGHPYWMFVAGPDADGEGMILSDELFEPGGSEET